MHYLTKIIRFIYTHLFYIQYNQFCQLRNFNLFLFLSDFQSIKIYTAFWHSI